MSKDQIISIEADHREEPSGIISMLSRESDVDISVSQLQIGDFKIGENVVVERKSAADFTASILDKRLFQQREMAKQMGAIQIYLIEGDVYRVGRIHPNALMGALSWLAAIEAVQIVYTPDASSSAQMIKTLARHTQHGLGYDTAQLRPPKPKTLPEQQMHLIQALPGMGVAKAEALLGFFGTPERVFMADASELQQVDGIGKKLASDVRAVLETT